MILKFPAKKLSEFFFSIIRMKENIARIMPNSEWLIINARKISELLENYLFQSKKREFVYGWADHQNHQIIK